MPYIISLRNMSMDQTNENGFETPPGSLGQPFVASAVTPYLHPVTPTRRMTRRRTGGAKADEEDDKDDEVSSFPLKNHACEQDGRQKKEGVQ
jgi:hypothetical protein